MNSGKKEIYVNRFIQAEFPSPPYWHPSKEGVLIKISGQEMEIKKKKLPENKKASPIQEKLLIGLLNPVNQRFTTNNTTNFQFHKNFNFLKLLSRF